MHVGSWLGLPYFVDSPIPASNALNGDPRSHFSAGPGAFAGYWPDEAVLISNEYILGLNASCFR